MAGPVGMVPWNWSRASRRLREENTVHVFAASISSLAGLGEHQHRVLTREERDRAGRFLFMQDRERFVSGRVLLRHLLGVVAEVSPADVTFAAGAYGKPYVARPSDLPLTFNVSHSGDLVLIALAPVAVGVDVERIRPGVRYLELGKQVFSKEEYRVLSGLPTAARRPAFFRCWTRKEAFIKATGDGVSFGLDRFTVAFHPNETAAVMSVAGDPEEASRWMLRSVSVAPGYEAAVAVARGPWSFAEWRLDSAPVD